MCNIEAFTSIRNGIKDFLCHNAVLGGGGSLSGLFQESETENTSFLSRLCEDFIGRNPELFQKHLTQLPLQLRGKMEKRFAFFSASPYILSAPAVTTD